MNYIKHRQYLLNQLVLIAGAWKARGQNDASLEQAFMDNLQQLHPNRKTALDILHKHLEEEVAA